MIVTALVLAAGASRRFGAADKLLADAGGVPILVRVLRAIDVAQVGDIVVVTRPEADDMRAAILRAGCRAPVRYVVNAHADSGLASSLVAGLAAVSSVADGLLVTPGDMAGLSRRTIGVLLAAFAAHAGERLVYAALPDGSQRNPVIWPRKLWPHLAQASGDSGGRDAIRTLRQAGATVAVSVADARELADIDTPQDLDSFLAGRSSGGDSDGEG